MPNNEILPFSLGAGANIISQTDYSGLTARQTGFQAGTAVSGQINKALRQPSFVASMIGQFIADHQSLDVLDDGDVSALETKFANSLRGFLGPNIVHVGLTDVGSANVVVATMNPPISSYSSPCLVIFRKKVSAPNTGACTCDFGAGPVALKDSGGADFSNAALLGGTLYMAAWDGSQFRVLGGAAQYTSVTNLTANSGDAIEVTSGGLVNFRTARGTHDTTVASNDRWPRGDGTTDISKYMTTAEYTAWLQANIITQSTPYYVEGTGVQYLSVPAKAGKNLMFVAHYDGGEGTYGGWPSNYVSGYLRVNIGANNIASGIIRNYLNWIDIWSGGRSNLTGSAFAIGYYPVPSDGTYNFTVYASKLGSDGNYSNPVRLYVM